MANYYYYNHHTDPSDCNQTSYIAQDYEPSIYNLFDYDPIPTPYDHIYSYTNNYNNTPSWSTSSSSITTAYSSFTPTEPKLIQYYYHQPDSHNVAETSTFYSYNNQIVQSDPAVEKFNYPDFDEYDSTPYGGGYDIIQTYGRPLPASDKTCYSRDGSKATPALPPATKSVDKLPPPPPMKKSEEKPPQPVKSREEKPPPQVKKKEEERQNDGIGEPGTEVVSQIPSGYGLEAIDLCGGFFGYWPCLTRYYAKRGVGERNACRSGECFYCGNGGVVGCVREQGSGAAEYLFGSLDPYVERRDGGGSFGQPIHCYERRFQEQPLHVVEVDHNFYDHHHRHDVDDQQDNYSWGIF